MFADLHVHTTVSDCSMGVETIIREAKRIGLTHIAFTDHDTAEQAWEHKEMAEANGLKATVGVEMSAYDFENARKVHILGYAYKTTEHIEAIGAETLRKRHANCLRQMAILEELGYHVPPEEVAKLAGRTIYKQHILDYLLRTGQSEMLFGDVYRRIFKNGGPCDFDIVYPRAEDCIRAIKADGGLAVLAHPGQMDNFSAIPRLIAAGLDGIEYNHHSHSEADKQKVADICAQAETLEGKKLFMTGGSDFHGRYEKTAAALGAYPAPESCQALFV